MNNDIMEGLKKSSFNTVATTVPKIGNTDNIVHVFVDNRAATRQAIILSLREKGVTFKTRSDWNAKPPVKSDGPDWDYHGIALHHAGNSYSCSADGADLIRKAEKNDIKLFAHISYHYAISCDGTIYEALDIREKGAHIDNGNTGVIGIVLLEDLTERGESYSEEYSDKSIWARIRKVGDWGPDALFYEHDTPPAIQVEALKSLVQSLIDFFPIKLIGGHREYQKISTGSGRACPGKYGMELVLMLRDTFKMRGPSK